MNDRSDGHLETQVTVMCCRRSRIHAHAMLTLCWPFIRQTPGAPARPGCFWWLHFPFFPFCSCHIAFPRGCSYFRRCNYQLWKISQDIDNASHAVSLCHSLILRTFQSQSYSTFQQHNFSMLEGCHTFCLHPQPSFQPGHPRPLHCYSLA